MASKRKAISKASQGAANKVSPSTGLSPNSEVAGAQQAIGQRRRQFTKERDSLKGAVALAMQATQHTKLGGFQGPEQRQLAQEVRARTKDIGNSLPGLLAPVQRDFKDDLTGLRSDLGTAQAGREAAITEAIQKVLQNRAQKHADVDKAFKEALRMVKGQIDANADPALDAKHKGHPIPQSESEWNDFEDNLRTTEGIDARAARKATRRLRTQVAAAAIHGAGSTIEQIFRGG